MDDNPEIRDRLNVNKSTYHNKRPRERFICFIRGAKWTKINHLNGPSPIHDTSTWLSQSIQSIRHVCCRLGMQKNLPWKCLRTAFGHYDFPSTSVSQQAWRTRKRYHLLFQVNKYAVLEAFLPIPKLRLLLKGNTCKKMRCDPKGGRLRLNVKVEPRSTFKFTRGLSYIASNSFTRVPTEKLRDSGNQP